MRDYRKEFYDHLARHGRKPEAFYMTRDEWYELVGSFVWFGKGTDKEPSRNPGTLMGVPVIIIDEHKQMLAAVGAVYPRDFAAGHYAYANAPERPATARHLIETLPYWPLRDRRVIVYDWRLQ